ncbi:hypothetical protein [Fusobacterium periodonticum]|uniref:Uncharacterized protein n=2 Tax=Fusobacterium periodonticum TaxID=860 RepID=A0AAD0HX50_9FUSO|nr:hypothetical protein [Fusobacterium periodonticum]AVQ26444.1 hypothetical protein C4N17_04310 [Fusobacterium periodonticum]
MAYLFRKRKVKKILFSEFDEGEKDLETREFFNRIFKLERLSKPFFYAQVIFLIIDTLFILFGGYKTYLEEVEFVKEFPRIIMSPLSPPLIKFMIPIVMWVFVFFSFIYVMILKNKENRRIAEMLDNLEKVKHLKFAKEDFLRSDRILATGVVGGDIKLGDRYLFSFYPVCIIPYIFIQKMKVKISRRGKNGIIYHLDITLKRPFQNIKIDFAKEDIAEKVREFSLERKKDLNEKIEY